MPLKTVLLPADAAAIARAASVLRAGGLVAIPTDTVYGVAAALDSPPAVERLYEAKLRPLDRPIPILIAGLDALDRIAADLPPAVQPLAAAFWPGALTLVVPRSAAISDAVSAGRPTVGVRWPDHPAAEALIRACGGALAVTSANLSGQPSPRDAADVLAQLAGRVDLVLDGGPALLGVESSIIDLTTDPPRLLRAGALPLDRLRAVLPTLAADA